MKLKKLMRFAPYTNDIYCAGKEDLHNAAAETQGAAADPVWAFLSSFILTSLMILLAAGLLYVDMNAREAAGIYENADMQAGTVQFLENLSAFGRNVRWIFPYFIIAVELFLLLSRLFSVIAKAIF